MRPRHNTGHHDAFQIRTLTISARRFRKRRAIVDDKYVENDLIERVRWRRLEGRSVSAGG